MIFGIKENSYSVLLAIATHILLMTAFVLQGHIYNCWILHRAPVYLKQNQSKSISNSFLNKQQFNVLEIFYFKVSTKT